MQLVNDLIVDDEYKLRITSRKLNSGKYQVKFSSALQKKKGIYGYMLVEAEETLKNVIQTIRQRIDRINISADYPHQHLYNLGKTSYYEPNFMIFQS